MILTDLKDIKVVKRRAIIINYNTKNVSLLALLSALRYSSCPVLLIDCESDDGSFEFFNSLLKEYDFDLLSMPLKIHGETLDILFSQLNDEEILLIDSDLEILSSKIIDFMTEFIAHKQVFGSGFLLEAKFLRSGFKNTEYYNSYLIERPWMPIALFKTAMVKEALNSGVSFKAQMVNNEFANIPKGIRYLIQKSFKVINLKTPNLFRLRYFVHFPQKVFYDTGAEIYEYLRYRRFLFFVHLPEPVHRDYVNHFWGLTRKVINPEEVVFFTENPLDTVKENLLVKYDFDITQPGKSPNDQQ